MLLQIAASATLLVASALLMRSVQNLQGFDVGFTIDHVTAATVRFDASRYTDDQVGTVTQEAIAHLREIPGVTNAAVVMDLPLTHNRDSGGFGIPGHPGKDGAPYVSIPYNIVTADYFAVLGLRFTRGHAWDGTSPDAGIVINETMARQFWRDDNPIGTVLQFPISKTNIMPVTVVGVVGDSTYYEVGEAPMPFVFLPAERVRPRNVFFVTRAAAVSPAMLESFAHAMSSVDSRLKASFQPFEDIRRTSLAPIRALALSASAFGLLALLLTGTGLYGVTAAAVTGRTREIGVRMALGARASDVQRDVVLETARLVAIAGVVGLVIAYFLAGTLRQWLFQVGNFDLLAYLSVAFLLGVLSLIAAWVPARRAARVDPVIALRS
jgi:predicted permease